MDMNTPFLVNASHSSSMDAFHSSASGLLSASLSGEGLVIVERWGSDRALRAKLVCLVCERSLAAIFTWAKSWKSGWNSLLFGETPVYSWKASSVAWFSFSICCHAGSLQVHCGRGIGGGTAGWKDRGVMWVGV